MVATLRWPKHVAVMFKIYVVYFNVYVPGAVHGTRPYIIIYCYLEVEERLIVAAD